jgi:hypothetical protein
MKIANLLLAGALLAATLPVNAQRSAGHEPRFTIAIHPLQLADYSYGADFEMQLGNPDHWVQVSYLYHTLDNATDGNYTDDNYIITLFTDDEYVARYKGHGLGLSYKVFFHRQFYYSGGVAYTHLDVRYLEDQLHAYRDEDGLLFHEYLYDQEVAQRFNRLSANLRVGYQSTFRRAFFVDVYLGLGYAYSFFDEDKRDYNNTIFSIGHRGAFPVGGVRLGFSF